MGHCDLLTARGSVDFNRLSLFWFESNVDAADDKASGLPDDDFEPLATAGSSSIVRITIQWCFMYECISLILPDEKHDSEGLSVEVSNTCIAISDYPYE
jgi:hypothetical protein